MFGNEEGEYFLGNLQLRSGFLEGELFGPCGFPFGSGIALLGEDVQRPRADQDAKHKNRKQNQKTFHEVSPLGNERLTGIVPGQPGITHDFPKWRYATLNRVSRYVYLRNSYRPNPQLLYPLSDCALPVRNGDTMILSNARNYLTLTRNGGRPIVLPDGVG